MSQQGTQAPRQLMKQVLWVGPEHEPCAVAVSFAARPKTASVFSFEPDCPEL